MKITSICLQILLCALLAAVVIVARDIRDRMPPRRSDLVGMSRTERIQRLPAVLIEEAEPVMVYTK